MVVDAPDNCYNKSTLWLSEATGIPTTIIGWNFAIFSIDVYIIAIKKFTNIVPTCESPGGTVVHSTIYNIHIYLRQYCL